MTTVTRDERGVQRFLLDKGKGDQLLLTHSAQGLSDVVAFAKGEKP